MPALGELEKGLKVFMCLVGFEFGVEGKQVNLGGECPRMLKEVVVNKVFYLVYPAVAFLFSGGNEMLVDFLSKTGGEVGEYSLCILLKACYIGSQHGGGENFLGEKPLEKPLEVAIRKVEEVIFKGWWRRAKTSRKPVGNFATEFFDGVASCRFSRKEMDDGLEKGGRKSHPEMVRVVSGMDPEKGWRKGGILGKGFHLHYGSGGKKKNGTSEMRLKNAFDFWGREEKRNAFVNLGILVVETKEKRRGG